MKTKCVVAVIGMLSLGSLAFAQSAQPYGFFAPGQIRGFGVGLAPGLSETAFHFGGGLKLISRSGLGAGLEMGTAGSSQSFRDTNFGVFSGNGYYVFKTGSKLEPFVTGGYTRTFGRDGLEYNWGNFGGGVNYWTGKHTGFLLEFRDHVTSPAGLSTGQLWNLRIGMTFRSKS